MVDKPTPPTSAQSSISFERGSDLPIPQYQNTPFPNITSRLPSLTSMTHSNPQDSISVAQIAPATSAAMDANKKPFDIGSLMSPPEITPYDSFSQGHTSKAATMSSITVASRDAQGRPRMPMSPPVSPMAKGVVTSDALATPSTSQARDYILYPRDEAAAPSPPQQPLFPPSDQVEHQRIVDGHIAARSAALFRESSPPPREHYELALHFKSQVMKHYTGDRKGWLKKERELLVADRKASAQRYQHKFATILPAKPAKPTVLAKSRSTPKPDRIVKPQPTAKPQGPRAIRTNPNPARQAFRVSATPEPSRRIVAPIREDRDFGALPDFCPPISSLPDKPTSLKVDWKGAPIDLSGDPNAHLLHPDELSLAANLRLDCATYLTSKRRIFIRRRECAHVGKEFRKTDAQQACKIDVNKASKLWTAFDRVGWLDLKWVAN